MPQYSYYCESCKKEFDVITSVAKRDDLQPCPHMRRYGGPYDSTHEGPCEQLATRKGIELNAKSFPGADSWRRK